MIRTLTIRIVTSTDTTGESNELLEEVVGNILANISILDTDVQYATTKGDIEDEGYEVQGHYEITENL